MAKTKKDSFRERLAARYPDLNMDDEDAYYDNAGKIMDEYEGYENNSKSMRDRIGKSPVFAEMMVAARDHDDFDPVVWMVENKALDLQSLADDPEYAKKLADAHAKYLEKREAQDNIEKQMATNMPASVEAVRAKAKELNLTDEQAEEVIGKLYQVMDDLIVGKIDPATFETVAKGMHYDDDVETAAQEGRAQGLQTKVDDKLRTLGGHEKAGGQPSVQTPKPKVQPHNPFVVPGLRR